MQSRDDTDLRLIGRYNRTAHADPVDAPPAVGTLVPVREGTPGPAPLAHDGKKL